MDLYEIASSMNTLADFCGVRDINALSPAALLERYDIPQADLLILFGGSIPCGCDVAAQAMLQNVAKSFMIVGGEGHTTESLRQKIKSAYPAIETAGRMEADMMEAYIRLKYGITPALLERESTNCGNNVTNALAMMHQHGMSPQNMIILQDATMQRRMAAAFTKYTDATIINYATYKARVIVDRGTLTFATHDIWGMWDMERYITLLMGEIPRLCDDINGYGPKGRAFIAHVDIPPTVLAAFNYLKNEYASLIRGANPLYASKDTPLS
jgi:uncharacterized SAM-binding protein YcdF (DUF218 family)